MAAQAPELAKAKSTDHTCGDSGNDEDHIFHELYRSIENSSKTGASFSTLTAHLQRSGIQEKDARLASVLSALKGLEDPESISFEAFKSASEQHICFLSKVLQGDLVIPDFMGFCAEIRRIFAKTEANTSGALADYIPQLSRVDPEQYAVSICTIDGQQYSVGNHDTSFVMESTCKPLAYCFALETHGEEKVHQHVGREPSGHGFNELRLSSKGLPHNPMINAGAIMSCSLIQPELENADRFEYFLTMMARLSGGKRPGFNNGVYLSEKQTADRNFALGYFMREKGAFPKGINLIETLEFYFQCCSIEVNTKMMSIVAASLANGGVCPLTGDRVLEATTVKDCLSLLASCGMYDFSGEFAFTIGLPAKSGVSGGILLVIPNVMGITIWSPRLDEIGNSVRGLEFCKELVQSFNFHNFDSLVQNSKKSDPRLQKNQVNLDFTGALIWAASQGDLDEMHRLVANGADLEIGDYDGRTAIHLASSEGKVHVVRYLLQQGVDATVRDRWGNTPLDDAHRGEHATVVALLEEKLASLGGSE